MNTSIRFGPADRDAQGFVKAPAAEPRSLADLLPTPQSIQVDAQQRPASKIEQALLVIVALIVISIAVWRFGFSGAAAPAPPAERPAATAASGGGSTTPSPIPAALLPAFAAPDGIQLGQIEATRAITPVAHFGDDWIQADVAGSGRIWLRAADWPSLAIVGPDLAPRRAPQAPAAAPAAAPAPFVPVATPPPPPPPCAQVGITGKMVQVCDYEELSVLEARAKAQWIATYGGNVGIVGTPSPQIVRAP